MGACPVNDQDPLVDLAWELERRLRDQGIDPADHDDADVEAILEAEHNWLGHE
jgi:hypothetical protein